jgi:hypothetical protein
MWTCTARRYSKGPSEEEEKQVEVDMNKSLKVYDHRIPAVSDLV